MKCEVMKIQRAMSGLAVGAALVGLTACGAAKGQEGADTSQSDASPREVEARSDAIYTKLWGTAEQQEAKHYLDFVNLNQGTVSCMKTAGFTFVPEWVPLYAGYEPNATQTSGWMGELDWAPSDEAARAGDAVAEDPYDPPSAAYDKALDTCGEKNSGFSAQLGSPVGADDASADWDKVVDDISDDLGPIEDYDICMKDNDVPQGTDGLESGAIGLRMYLEGYRPTSVLNANKPNKAWVTYLEREDQALQADRECREDEYLQGLSILGTKLDDFEADHADALAEAEAGWQTILRDAQQAGFPPKS